MELDQRMTREAPGRERVCRNGRFHRCAIASSQDDPSGARFATSRSEEQAGRVVLIKPSDVGIECSVDLCYIGYVVKNHKIHGIIQPLRRTNDQTWPGSRPLADPKVMMAATDPVGPDNDRVLADVTGTVVAGWDTNADPARVIQALAVLPQLHALGATKDGHPHHLLYVPADAPLIEWMPKLREADA